MLNKQRAEEASSYFFILFMQPVSVRLWNPLKMSVLVDISLKDIQGWFRVKIPVMVKIFGLFQ
jgi:hypothetical protein